MRAFRLLVWRRLRQSPVRAAVTSLAIGAGVTLAVSITILVASIERSVDAFGSGLAGPAPLRIVGASVRGGLPESAVSSAERVGGVADVVPMVQAVTAAEPSSPGDGSDLRSVLVLGVDCRAQALVGDFGCDPAVLDQATGPLVVGADLRTDLGPGGILRTDLGPILLDDVPDVAGLAILDVANVVVMPLAQAQERYTRPDQVDVAYVLPADGADVSALRARLEETLGDHLSVLAADEPPPGSDAILGNALPLYSLIGIFALGVGAVLVSSTANLSLEARRRELATLGALGSSRRRIVASAVAEMASIGVVGGLLGSLGGAAVAAPIVASFSDFTESVAGVSLSTYVPPSVVVVGAALGALLGGGAAVLPAWRAGRLDVAAELSGREPAAAARPARLVRRLVIWSMVVAAGATGCYLAQRDGGLEPWQSIIITPSFLAVAVGGLFAAAALAPLLVSRLAAPAIRTASPALRLAVAAARRDHRRTGVLAVVVGAAVVVAFLTEGSSDSARASIEASFERDGRGVNVSTVAPKEQQGPFMPPTVVAGLADVPGVAEVSQGRFLITGPPGELIAVQAITGNRLNWELVDGQADRIRLRAGEALIGEGLARRQQIRAGDEVRLATPRGFVELPVQGVWSDGNFNGANVTVSTEQLTDLYGPQPPSFVFARPEQGISEQELATRIEAADLDPLLRTRRSQRVADDIADQVDSQFESFRAMQRSLMLVLFVAVLSSLLLSGVQRRRELGLLAAVGTAPTGLARVLLVEAGMVALVGVAISAVLGPVMMWTFNQSLPFVIGFRNPLVLPWAVVVSTGLAAVVLALLGAVWPARRAARVEVLDALRYE